MARKRPPTGPNQFFPGIDAADPAKLARAVEDLYDRVNFLLGRMNEPPPKPAKDDKSIQAAVLEQGVAIQAATDALTALQTFVGFGAAQPVSTVPTIAGGGSPGQVIYVNSAGNLAGDAGLTYADTTDVLTALGGLTISNSGAIGQAADRVSFYSVDVATGVASGFVIGESGSIFRLNETVVYLSSAQTSNSATPAATALSLPVQASTRYHFRAVLPFTETDGGVRFSLQSSTATVTNLRGTWIIQYDGTPSAANTLNLQVSALATNAALASTGGINGQATFEGSMLINAAGNIIVSFGEQTGGGGNATLHINSSLQLQQG